MSLVAASGPLSAMSAAAVHSYSEEDSSSLLDEESTTLSQPVLEVVTVKASGLSGIHASSDSDSGDVLLGAPVGPMNQPTYLEPAALEHVSAGSEEDRGDDDGASSDADALLASRLSHRSLQHKDSALNYHEDAVVVPVMDDMDTSTPLIKPHTPTANMGHNHSLKSGATDNRRRAAATAELTIGALLEGLGSKEGNDQTEIDADKLTPDQRKLLYLISRVTERVQRKDIEAIEAEESAASQKRFHQKKAGLHVRRPTFRKAANLVLNMRKLRTLAPTGELWVRRVALLVYMYEAIVAQLFQGYDYAPGSEFNGDVVVPMNVSHEGADDLVDLQSLGLLLSLRLASRSHRNISAYQLSTRGKDLITREPKDGGIPHAERLAVDTFLATWVDKGDEHCIADAEARTDVSNVELAQLSVTKPFGITWDQRRLVFELEFAESTKISSVTKFEDVSYACTPYLPKMLHAANNTITKSPQLQKFDQERRQSDIKFVLQFGSSNMRDTDQDFNVVLGGVRLIFGEWIPMGSNEITAMQERSRGSGHQNDALVGGQVQRAVDTDSVIQLTMTGLSAVFLRSSDEGQFVNYEAHVYLPEDEGVMQFENFGVHMHADGDVVYGVDVDAVMQFEANHIPVDLLSRLKMDLHEDSTRIRESLQSCRQRMLLDNLYPQKLSKVGICYQGSHYSVVLAKEISPRLKAAEYLDGEGLQNDLSQVLGFCENAVDLHEAGGGVLIQGMSGILVVADDLESVEWAVTMHAQVEARSLFLKSFYHRTFELEDDLEVVRYKIGKYVGRTKDLHSIRTMIAELGRREAMLESSLMICKSSVATQDRVFAKFEAETRTKTSLELLGHLKTEAIRESVRNRLSELFDQLEVFKRDLKSLNENTDQISERQMFRVQESLQNNTRSLEELFRANETSASSLEILQAVLGGSLAFGVLDRLTGEFSIKDTPWGQWIFDYLVLKPGVWFVLSMAFFFLIIAILNTFMKRLVARGRSMATLRLELLAHVRAEPMQNFLDSITMISTDVERGVDGRSILKYMWDEPSSEWGGSAVSVELTYDESNRLLSTIQMQYRRGGPLSEEFITSKILARLKAANLFVRDLQLDSYLDHWLDTRNVESSPSSSSLSFTEPNTPTTGKKSFVGQRDLKLTSADSFASVNGLQRSTSFRRGTLDSKTGGSFRRRNSSKKGFAERNPSRG